MVKIFQPLKPYFGNLARNRKFVIGFTIFIATVLVSVIGRRFLPYNPLRVGRFPMDHAPTLEHPLGTDSLGRDVFGQLLFGIENSLQIGFIVAIIGTLTGASIGFIAGYYGKAIDAALRLVTDVFLVLPMLPMLILIASFMRVVKVWMMAFILSIFSWAWPARQVRGQALSLKERDFVYMARLSGMKRLEIVFIELMPHMIQYLGASFFFAVLWAILSETGLELIGLGPQNTMTIGMLLYWAMFHAAVFRGLWWWWSAPLFSLILLLISLYLIHIGLDEVANPRLRTRGK